MTRSLVRPLTRSLVRSLVRGPSLDADASAYIAELVSAGATVTSVQSDAIDTFIRAEKDGGRWDLIKRMYLPIWELAAPNAICMRSLTSGTFVGEVTHGAGFVQGDGSTGYFDPGASGNLRTLGMSGANLHYMQGVSLQGSALAINMGVWDGVSGNRCQLINELSPESRNAFASPILEGAAVNNSAQRDGILIGSSTSSSDRYLHRRKTAGATVVSASTASTANVPDSRPYIMARNNLSTGNPDLRFNGRVFASSYGLAIPQSAAPDYSANLKTLWETATGLTLP